MHEGNEIILAAAWLAGGLLCLVAFGGVSIGRLLRRRGAEPSVRRPNGREGDEVRGVPDPFTGKAYVIDGDTIRVRRKRVRLFGMDAPELSQRGGSKARSHLIGFAGGRLVTVHPVDIDCYGRIVARVRLGEIDLSEAMVRDGFARAMDGWHVDYMATEFEARRCRRGLWRDDPAGGIGDPAAHRRTEAARGARRW